MNTNGIPEANQEFFELKKHGIDTPSTIGKVLNGELIACELTEYLNPVECLALVRSVNFGNTMNFLKGEAHGTEEVQRLKPNRPQAYFKAVAEQPLFDLPPYRNFVNKLLGTLDKSSDKLVGIAYSSVYQSQYSPAAFKEFKTSLDLHSDFAGKDATGWNPIENVTQQWGFLIKLTQVDGGRTYVYNKQWEPNDELYLNREDRYSYDMCLVKDYDEIAINGAKGSLILFNSRNYHRVERIRSGSRWTIGGFIGLLEKKQRLVIWS